MSYQSNRILSGGTVSTPTVITGKNPTDLISAGGMYCNYFNVIKLINIFINQNLFM